jgi:16S rRNA (guanine527-N7)-methyltransferase
MEDALLQPVAECDVKHDNHPCCSVLTHRTGNGLPGIPLAITHPYNDFTLVESSEKKAKIVQQMVTALGLRNVTVINARAETLKDKFDFIVGRAVAPLPVYVKNIFRLCKKRSNVAMPNGRQGNSKHFGPGLLYIKGGDFDDELGLAGVRRFNVFNIRDLSHHVLNDSEKKVNVPNICVRRVPD